ncbi:MAG: hypothetical protein A2Y57_02210 [Candidatus Woykebacteria bacterium RBG_13_40_7b]|uniref:Type 4 fimbrial biogenesis protein PilX N-terminal domain-containing protein n=1 Tax=Candidatus Woykebacteria bacterium RBG_13_40_7b TaxID=1802594 RepID=A0A1G1W8S8_9BACT|nr:MAG: hypothetical protein A2Y57_02210 [Candidatus Woykebacteria bacterium RBG_13_40_7b]
MNQKGQALVSIILISTFAIIVIASLTMLGISLNQKRLEFQQSQKVYYLAETGIDNAILLLLRSASAYTGSSSFSIEGVTINTTVWRFQENQNTIRKSIYVVANAKENSKTVWVQVEIDKNTNKLTVLPDTWREL